jgi:hypothetical protein
MEFSFGDISFSYAVDVWRYNWFLYTDVMLYIVELIYQF